MHNVSFYVKKGIFKIVDPEILSRGAIIFLSPPREERIVYPSMIRTNRYKNNWKVCLTLTLKRI